MGKKIAFAVLGLLVLWRLFFWPKSYAATVGAPMGAGGMSPEDQQKLVVVNALGADMPGGTGNYQAALVPAGPGYPGYYLTAYGGYVNPETGESYSPGSSPAVYNTSAYETGAMERPYIPAALGPSSEQLTTQPGGENYNPATANATIY